MPEQTGPVIIDGTECCPTCCGSGVSEGAEPWDPDQVCSECGGSGYHCRRVK